MSVYARCEFIQLQNKQNFEWQNLHILKQWDNCRDMNWQQSLESAILMWPRSKLHQSVSQIGRQQSIKGINNIRQIVYVRFGHYRGVEEHTHLMPVTVVSLGLLKATGSIVTAGGFHAHHLQALPLPVKSTQNTRISANGTFILCLHHPMSEAQFLQAYLGWNAAADMTSLQESHQEWNWQYD